MVNIVIDGKELTVEPGTMIIEAADKAGINIPRFCYHKKLSIAANCRMCLIEVEKVNKPLPACATPITDGMVIYTKSKAAIDSQRAVMEFLLINHPLDCPVCDQGGECELQDVSMDYGNDLSVYTEGKRAVSSPDIGSLVATEMTRCIHCTRCVRFGTEVAGVADLGAVGRGEHMEITTYVQHSLQSELSGNIIDLCPVGALTSKPFRFKARAWEMQQYPSIVPHDILGTNVFVNTYEGRVLRVLPRENEAINEVWISDRDRFSYEALNVSYRAQQPMVKVKGQWKEVTWEYVLDYTVSALRKLVAGYGVENIGALISPTATLEEMYLLQKLIRGIGGNNIDHRLQEIDDLDQADSPRIPGLGLPIAEVEQVKSVLLVGSNIRKEQPLLAHRLNKAYQDIQTEIFTINPIDFDFVFPLAGKQIVDAQGMLDELALIAKVAIDVDSTQDEALKRLLHHIEPNEQARRCYESLRGNESSLIWLGGYAQMHPQASLLRTLVRIIAESTNSKWGILAEGGNAAGAWLSGAVPHRTAGGSVLEDIGYSAHKMLQKQLKCYFLAGVEPELDCNDSSAASKAMKKAELVISCASFVTPSIKDSAHIILPIAAFTESAGTYINAQGDWQKVKGVIAPPEKARPLWKILRVLGSLLELKEFNYQSLDEVTNEIEKRVQQMPEEQSTRSLLISDTWIKSVNQESTGYSLLKNKGIYAVDMTVRQAYSLQKTPEVVKARVADFSPQLAKKLGINSGDKVKIKQGQAVCVFEVVISTKIAPTCVNIPGGVLESSMMGACYSSIELERLI